MIDILPRRELHRKFKRPCLGFVHQARAEKQFVVAIGLVQTVDLANGIKRAARVGRIGLGRQAEEIRKVVAQQIRRAFSGVNGLFVCMS